MAGGKGNVILTNAKSFPLKGRIISIGIQHTELEEGSEFLLQNQINLLKKQPNYKKEKFKKTSCSTSSALPDFVLIQNVSDLGYIKKLKDICQNLSFYHF